MQDCSLVDWRDEGRAGEGGLIRLTAREHAVVLAAARDRGMTPEEWVSSLLGFRPRWNHEESRYLGEIASRVRQVVTLVDGMPADDGIDVLRTLYTGLAAQVERLNECQAAYWSRSV